MSVQLEGFPMQTMDSTWGNEWRIDRALSFLQVEVFAEHHFQRHAHPQLRPARRPQTAFHHRLQSHHPANLNSGAACATAKSSF